MLAWAATLLALAAVGGLGMAILKGRGTMPPLWLAAGHGLLAAAGLVVLAVAALDAASGPLPWVALVLFVAAGLWGLELLRSHLRRGSFPMTGVAGHGVLALVAFILLLVEMMR